MLYNANTLINCMNNIQASNLIIVNFQSMDQTSDVVQQLSDQINIQMSNTDSFFQNINALLSLSILSLAYLVSNIQEMIYSHLRGVFVQGLTAELMLNLVNSILVIYWVFNHFVNYANGLDDYPYYQQGNIVIERMQKW